jgi:hypothetical protein
MQSIAPVVIRLLCGASKVYEERMARTHIPVMFRAKEMTMEEWSRFQETVDEAALNGDDQIPALLVRDFAEAQEKSLVLLAGTQLDWFEARSPGGWIDYPEAVEDRWIFLAGDRYLVKRLGLKLGAN